MFSYGLKLWSTNSAYMRSAEDLLARGVFQYVELFTVPGTLDSAPGWAGLLGGKARFVIHAPHYMAGVNLADPACRERNRQLAAEAFRFSDALKADKIIFHPGVNGRDEEAASQLKALGDKRILVENKPYAGIQPGLVCAGHTPAGIRMIKEFSGAGFCLDFGHALAAAASLGRPEVELLDAFFALSPDMFHAADGKRGSVSDGHLHLGSGDYDFRAIVPKIPRGAMITLETAKNYKDRLDDCEADVRFFDSLVGKEGARE